MHKVFIKGYVGDLGTRVLIEKKYDDLSKHFSKEYLNSLINLLNEKLGDGEIPSLNLQNEDNFKTIDFESEIIGKGGVLAALWKICERNKWGLEYSLNKIPILQGTIEISNFFDINPYRLLTSNSVVIAVSYNSENEFENYIKDNIINNSDNSPIVEIGETNKSKKRVRIDGEAPAFLTKDFKDEIDKIIYRYTKDNNRKLN